MTPLPVLFAFMGAGVVEKTLSKPNKVNRSTIKKEQAIQLWRETNGHISKISRAIGISRTTFYEWMNKDEDFALALLETEGELNDEIRDQLITKAEEGDMTAIIFYLKSRHPDFEQRKATAVRVQGPDIKVEFIDYEG